MEVSPTITTGIQRERSHEYCEGARYDVIFKEHKIIKNGDKKRRQVYIDLPNY